MADDLTIPEENNEEETQEVFFEMTTTAEYIQSAAAAWQMAADIDTAILSKADEQRVRRMRRQSLRIMATCINDLYEELFDDNNDGTATE